MKRLKQNIILKWPKETFGGVVFVFIELLSRGFKEVNPTGYFDNSDYFEHLLKLDMLKDNSIFKRIFKKGKCIR